MKKFIVVAIQAFMLSVIYPASMKAQQVTYPVSSILADAALEDVHTKLTANSLLNVSGDGQTITITGASLYLTFSDLSKIYNNGGSISDCVLVIKAPIGFEQEDVTTSCPDITNGYGNSLTYENYFKSSNVKIYNGYSYTLSVNHNGHILTGTEIVAIGQHIQSYTGSGSLSDYILLVTSTEYVTIP